MEKLTLKDNEQSPEIRREFSDQLQKITSCQICTDNLTDGPCNIVVFCKPGDDNVFKNFIKLCKHIQSEYKDVTLYTEILALEALKELYSDNMINEDDKITMPILFEKGDQEYHKQFRYIITLGGDGTILYASKQFHSEIIPPLICFAQGSLGYLCNFSFEDYKMVLKSISKSDGTIHMDNRMRLKASVPQKPIRDIYRGNDLKVSDQMLVQDYHVLNEVVIDRGPSPYAIQLSIFFDGNFMTNMVGDGLIISTPTGSTAYNMSAGGSIVQANTQCICLTPLAPHSLSFRPLILPASTQITVKKFQDNRNAAWVSMDGATRFQLDGDEEIKIEASLSTLSMVVHPSDNLMDLWSQRLSNQLNWNQRDQLKPLVKKSSNPVQK